MRWDQQLVLDDGAFSILVHVFAISFGQHDLWSRLGAEPDHGRGMTRTGPGQTTVVSWIHSVLESALREAFQQRK